MKNYKKIHTDICKYSYLWKQFSHILLYSSILFSGSSSQPTPFHTVGVGVNLKWRSRACLFMRNATPLASY